MKKLTRNPGFCVRSSKTRSKKSRLNRFRPEFLSTLDLLEKRLLLASITISSNQDLVPYFQSDTNTYDINAGSDSVTINDNVILNLTSTSGPTSNFTISGGQVTIGSNVSIITDGYNANGLTYPSGMIDISGKNVTVGNNSILSANGATDSLDGDISILAKNEKFTLGFNFWMQLEDLYNVFTHQSANIDLGNNTQIVGANISLNVNSGNPLQYEDITNVAGDIASLIGGVFGHPDPLSLPVTIQSWSPYSGLTIGTDAILESSTTINVSASSESVAKGHASWFEVLKSRFGFAFGFFFSDARANVSFMPGATLQADGNINITSNVDNRVELDVGSVKNYGISPVNPDSVNIAYGLGSLTTNSVIEVQAGSLIDSSQGSVSIIASATDSNSVRVDGKNYRDGLAAVSVGTLLTDANVQVIVDGSVSSGVPQRNQADPAALVFNQVQSVDLANNQLNFPAGTMQFETGQELIFDSVNGSTIPGLQPGKVYYAIVNPNQPDSLQLAKTLADAQNGQNIVFPSVYPTLTIGDLILPITLIDNTYSNAILLNFDTLPDGTPVLPNGNGTTVSYTPVQGQFIGYNDSNGNLIGPLAAGNYTVNLFQWPNGSAEAALYPLAIQLVDSQGQTVILNPNSYFTTSNGTNLQVSLLNTETSTVDFNFSQPTENPSGLTPLPVPNQQVDLTNGQPLIYTSGLNASVGNLTNGQTYWAIVNPAQSGVIQLASSIAQSEAANPSVQIALPMLVTASNQDCLASTVSDNFGNSGESSTLTLNSDNSYSLTNNATSGTFQLSLNDPAGSFTTIALAYNISPADLQTALNNIAGIQATVSGSPQNWLIGIQFEFEIGNFENGTELTFNSNPQVADGTAVIFEGVTGKPVPGLTSGQTYYAFNQSNPNFISQYPQYILTLKTTNDASAPNVEFELSQSMTDSNGQNYTIAYSDASSNILALALPEVTQPASVNDDALIGGTVMSNPLATPELMFYTLANSGTFTISLTNPSGTTLTTAPLAYNATSSEVQQALNDLAGVSATVVGTGNLSSPWIVSGIDPSWSVSGDSSNLLYNGLPSSLSFDVFAENTQQIWVSNATGGTFTVTLNFGSNQLITAPLPYNVSRQAFAQAINNLGFQASVYGSGTTSDPWTFMVYYNSITTGEALTFNDAWGNSSLGMLNGQAYYAVTSETQFNPSEVFLSLASSQANAKATPAILLEMQEYLQFEPSATGVMSGTAALVAVPAAASGVIISSSLNSSDYLTNKADIGLYPPIKGLVNRYNGNDPYDVSDVAQTKKALEDINSVYDSEFGTLFYTDDEKKELEDSLKKNEERLKDFNYKDPKSFLEASLGLAVMIVNNNSQVIIGSQAMISSGDDITLKSNLVEQFHSQADAGVTRTRESESKKGNLAAALGLTFSIVNNTSRVIVQPNAEMNAAGQIDINSNIRYPFAWNASSVAQLVNNWSDDSVIEKIGGVGGILASIVTQALTGTNANVGNWLFNSSSNSSTAQRNEKTGGLLGSAIGGSVVIVDMSNNNLAQICDGVKVNQNSAFQNATYQGLSVNASTQIDQLSGTGQMDQFLNIAGVLAKEVVAPSQTRNLIGGSVNVVTMDNTTQTLIGGDAPQSGNATASSANGPTLINFGNGGLNLAALTDINYISLSQSGGKAAGIGLEASVAVISVENQNTTSAIFSAQNAPVIRKITNTNGNIIISASDDSMLVPASGDIISGKSINLGFSSSTVQLNRNVSAFIGSANTTVSPAQTSWPVIQAAGNVSIMANVSGQFVPVSLAGSVMTKTANETGKEIPGYPGNHFGLGVSGDYSEAIVQDYVNAGINGGNLTGVSNRQTVIIEAVNNTRLNLGTGSASLQFEKGRDSAVGFGGAASYVDYNSYVTAAINNADITSFAIEIGAQNSKTVGTFAAGLDGASVAGVGIEVAGSVAINQVTNQTVAEIVDTIGTDLGAVNLNAIEIDNIWAAAGTVTFVTSIGSRAELDEGKLKTKIGLGLGYAQNLLDSSTNAIISNSRLNQNSGGISINAEQASRSFVLAAGAVFEAGQGTGITAYGMIAINQYTNADVKALVENSQINSASSNNSAGMTIASQLIPIMITAAGDLGLGLAWKSGSGAEVSVGAGVSVTTVSITGNSVAAVINSNIVLNQGNLAVSAYTGQAANVTSLYNTLSSLNLPLGNYNLYSLAIAGGLSTAIDPVGDLAVGVNGVGAGIGSTTQINTLANISAGSEIQLLGQASTGGLLSVNALENLNVYDNAGGASIEITVSKETSVGVVVGIGAGVHTDTGNVIASVTDSSVTTSGAMNVTANTTSNVNIIGFGVALDDSVAESGGMAVAVSASSGTTSVSSTKTINASITNGNISSGDALNVTADDNSNIYTGVGSGSLSVAFGSEGGVSLSAGASVSVINTTHSISAIIGSSNATDNTQTVIQSSGLVTVQAVNSQSVTSQVIAVASSVSAGGEPAIALAGAGASSCITTNNNITAAILYGSSVNSVQSSTGNSGISVTATDQANLHSTVGTGALDVAISEIPVGASLGISLSEITNNDAVNALVQGACLTTQGGDVTVQAVGRNSHLSESVATSVSISLGVAGAGGNSNVYDNANFLSSVDSGSTVQTGNSSTGFGGLSVLANTSESVMAQIYGGTGGIGSIGVFLSDASRSGSTSTSLATDGILNVGDLTVSSNTNQTVTSEGMSVTIGGLAGTGEVHQVELNELVQTTVSGSGSVWAVNGNLSIGASSTNQATAQTSGAGDGKTSISIGELGVGYYQVSSNVNPTVNVTISDANISASGISQFGAISNINNTATARAGSGSLVGGDAALAQTDNSPEISLSTTNLTLNSNGTTFLTGSCITYGTFADSIYATIAGGSAAIADNSSSPNLSLSLGCGTLINSKGSVIVNSLNNIMGIGTGDISKAEGIMARVGSGGIVGGFGASSNSCLTGTSDISLAEGVSILAMHGGAIQIGSSQNWFTNQLSYVNSGSAVGGTSINSSIDSCLTSCIVIGSDVSLTAPDGSLGIGTSINSQTTSDTYSYTFGLVSATSGNSQNTQCTTQSVIIGENSSLVAGGDITVAPGVNPVNKSGSGLDNYSSVIAHCSGLISVPIATAGATTSSDMQLMIDSGTQIVSDMDVVLGPIQGFNNALWYTFTIYDGSKGTTKNSTNGAKQTSSTTINGTVVAGNTHELNINIPETGNNLTVNGQNVSLTDASGTMAYVKPQAGANFVPFQLGYQTNYNATQMLDGLDSTSQHLLSKYISNTPVTAITLANMAATGGQVVIYAEQLSGNATISAYVPNITINNNSPAYLLLDGIVIPNILNMGCITLLGNATLPTGIKTNSQSGLPTITINQNYNQTVGNGTTAGPAIGTFGPILNSAGSVSIFNANGSFVQQAQITAQKVSISTPNAAMIINTPDSYFGSGGDITNYWINDTNYISPGLNSYVQFSTANLAATTAATVLYLKESGATNSNEFSNWLYNNKSIPITDFININISASDIGSNYPGTGKNWGSTEQGTGIIFFGSEIPYIWQTGSISFSSGSQYLSQSCATGYLDTYSNAQIWSAAASGNPADNTLNIAQGTGPQYASNVGRGIYPIVPSDFPTSLTVSNPQNATLGTGLNAAQLEITALYIDINSPINVGVLNNGVQATLPATLGGYISNQIQSNPAPACITLPSNYLGGSNSGLSGYFDVLANQIVLNPLALSGGTVGAVFNGCIISTTNSGQINVTSNAGQNLIDNQSGYPLVIQGIGTPEANVAGIVQFNDNQKNLSTLYIYRGNNVVEQYQGNIGSNISQMNPIGNLTSTSASYSPSPNLAWQWSQEATISRNLSFKNTNNSYDLYGPGYNDSWSWGGLDASGTAPSNYASSNNPFMTGITSKLVSLNQPITDFTEIISAEITAQETAETLFINNTGYAWNFGPCTTWTWTYPTEIQLSISSQVPACNPINLNFAGVSCGSLTVNSNASLMLDGNIQFPGSVNITSSANISQATGAAINASQISLNACGSIGGSSPGSLLNVISANPVNANSADALSLSSSSNLIIGSLVSQSASVVLQAGGSIIQGTSGLVTGTDITLNANGTIGTQSSPVNIQTQPNQLETGSVNGGLLTASAPDSIYLTQNSGDLRIGSVSTTSSVGVVSLSVTNGNIVDGNIADIYDFNSGNLTAQQISRVIDSIRTEDVNYANLTVSGFEGSVDQNYLQYWTMIANQTTVGNLTLNNGVYGLQFPLATVLNGNVNLTANGISYYQQQANLYYANSANQTSNASAAQVNAYAAIIYENAVNVFQNNLAYGADWSSLPQFQAYQSNYTFTASNATVSALTYGAYDVTNSFALLSLDALSPANNNTFGNDTRPAIQTAVLSLSASGSIGLMQDPVEIDINSIQSGNLTTQQKSLLTMATHAGELQYVGINNSGEKVVFSEGSEPANVTITGVIVQVEQPLFINLTDIGLAIVNAGSSINLTETEGNLNILGMQSAGHSAITSQQDIYQTVLQGSTNSAGWSQNASGILGYNSNGQWTATSLQTQILDIADGIVCKDHVVNGNWVGSANNTSTNQPGLDIIQLTYGEIGEANAYWYPLKIEIPTTGNFSINFSYQATSSVENSSGGITLAFQNEGLNALGSNGDGLGYLGITGNAAAFQIYTQPSEDNYYPFPYYEMVDNTSGTNFVTTNSTGDYNTSFNQSLSSGNPIEVQLIYNADEQIVIVTLTDLWTGQSNTNYYPDVDLASVLGDQAYIGFTGSSSGLIQIVTDFSVQNLNGTVLQNFQVMGPSNLRMVAGGSIGTSTNNLNIRLSGELNSYVENELFVTSNSNGNLTLGSISAGGLVQINAPGNILPTDNLLMGSIAGFGTDGTGWTINSGNGTASVSNNVLQLNNTAIDPSDGVSFASAYDNTLYTVDNSFISSFLYTTTTPGSDFYFVLQNGQSNSDSGSDISKNPEFVGLLLNSGAGSPEFQTVGLMYNGTMHNLQIPGEINLASGDPIHVVLTYNRMNYTLTVSLTDTVTNQNYSFVNPDIDMLKFLGTAQAQIGFYSQGTGNATQQSVQGFSFSYGSPTIRAQSALLSSIGGMIGTSQNPILTLVTGNINASAPDGVYMIQTDGDMYVQSVNSSGNVSLSAPTGAVVGTGSGSVQATGLLRAASVITPLGVNAEDLQIQSLYSIGTAEKPIDIQAKSLGATTVLGVIRLSQFGPLMINGGIQAGGLLSILADSSLEVSSAVKASGSISIETLPDYSGISGITIANGGTVSSLGDMVRLIGGNGVCLSAGSQLTSFATGERNQVVLASLSSELIGTEKFNVNITGSIQADHVQIDSQQSGQNHYLNLPSVSGFNLNPVIQYLGTGRSNKLNIDDSVNELGRFLSFDHGTLTTPYHQIHLNAIDSVLLTLGSGPDLVDIGNTTGLTHLSIETGAGDDLIKTVLSNSESLNQQINGGPGVDRLILNSRSQPIWVSQKQIATLKGQVQFQNLERIAISGTSAANGLPMADTFDFIDEQTKKNLTNAEYVNLVYQKVLDRNATDAEIALGTKMLEKRVLNRDQFARRILASSESLAIQVNAWYETYLNRQASSQEIESQVSALRRGQSARLQISRLLAGPEFYQRTQQTVSAATASDRYLIGLYRYAINPTSTPAPGVLAYLKQTLRQKGRLAVANQVLNSDANASNQTESISININQRTANGNMAIRRIGPNGLTARLLGRK